MRRGAQAELSDTVPSATILYLSVDGLLQPIAQANVLAYLRRLGEASHAIHILSLERPADLADAASVSRLTLELRQHGLAWTYLPYASGSGRAMLSNLRHVYLTARRLIASHGIRLVHARSYPPAAVAWWLHRRTGVDYLFDMRGYWVDEKRAMGHWFTRPWVYALGKRIERRMVRDAAAVVTLTQLQADDLQPLRPASDPITVIPTCTDYAAWNGARPEPKGLVIAYIGSVTNSYCVDESLRLFALVRALRADAHLLCLTRQRAEMESSLRRAGVEAAACTLAFATHEEMPAWLRKVRWGLIFLQPGLAKRGSVPTKLAEFLAAGVRPIQYGCNSEVSAWVVRAGSGLVLPDLSDDSLRRAAVTIAHAPASDDALDAARRLTQPYFDIALGVARYRDLYARLLSSGMLA